MFFQLLPHLSLITAAVVKIISWYLDASKLFLYSRDIASSETIVQNLIEKKYTVIGKECIPDTNKCFLIVDSYYVENDRLTTKRDLLLADNPDFSLTGVEVQSKKPISSENCESRDWPVNKLVVNSRYARMLIAAGFIIGSLDFDEMNEKEVLIGGLGGGVMSNFFSEISFLNIKTTVVEKEELIIDIAERYFDHYENDFLNVLHLDFLDFIKKGDKQFDVIIVDICENENTKFMCPIIDALTDENIKNMSINLKERGTLAVNVYTTEDNDEYENKVIVQFMKFFKSCFYVEYIEQKKILICTKMENWTWKKRKETIMSNIRIIDDMFEFNLTHFIK